MTERKGGAVMSLVEDPERVMLERVADAVPRCMRDAGMSPREMTAEWERIPQDLRDAITWNGKVGPSSEAVRGGNVTRNGFGLSGSAGVGKSFALASMFRLGCAAVARKRLERGTNTTEAAIPWFRWCRWPEFVNTMRVTSTREGGLEDVQSMLSLYRTAPYLVLDDLGAERVKNYEEDWATSQLDLLVDSRHGAMLPTWFTTNLSKVEFHKRYGARFYSRLCGDNPLVEVTGKTDLRIQKGAV